MIWERKAVQSDLDINSFADIASVNRAIRKSKKLKSNDIDIDKLIDLEETKAKQQEEKLEKLEKLKATATQKQAELKAKQEKLVALRKANKKREEEMHAKFKDIPIENHGEAQAIVLARINTGPSPTETLLSKQFDQM